MAQTKQTSMSGISRIDQPEKHNHGYFVRLTRWGKTHSAFFSDKKYGGQEQALAAAQEHRRELVEKFGPAGTTLDRRWTAQAVGGPSTARVRKPDQPLMGSSLAWVQCSGYRCLAYTNARGQWVNFYTHKVLTDFVEVIG